jgi:hypothetical protein
MSGEKPFQEHVKPTKVKRRNSEHFEKKAEKDIGQSLGFVGAKKDKESQQIYMVKRQGLRQNLADVVASEVGRLIDPDYPKDTILNSAYKLPDNVYKKDRFKPDGTAIASRMIPNSENLESYFYRTAPKIRNESYDTKDIFKFLFTLPGGREAFAFNLLIGNTDCNPENYLVVTNPETKAIKVVPIDLGLAWQQFGDKDNYVPCTPRDVLKSNSQYFDANSILNHEFVDTCKEIIAKIEKDPQQLKQVINNVANNLLEISEHYKNPLEPKKNHTKYFDSVMDTVFPSDQYRVVWRLIDNIKDHVKLFKDFTTNVEFQLAIWEGNEPKIKEMLEQNPKSHSQELSMPPLRYVDFYETTEVPLAKRIIEWLPETSYSRYNLGNSNYEDYLSDLDGRKNSYKEHDKTERREARVTEEVKDNMLKAPVKVGEDLGEKCWIVKIDGRHKTSHIKKILQEKMHLHCPQVVRGPKGDSNHVEVTLKKWAYKELEEQKEEKSKPKGRD